LAAFVHPARADPDLTRRGRHLPMSADPHVPAAFPQPVTADPNVTWRRSRHSNLDARRRWSHTHAYARSDHYALMHAHLREDRRCAHEYSDRHEQNFHGPVF